MPNHVRQQIREAAVAAITGLETTGGSVFESRALILNASFFPLWIVTTENERNVDEEMTMGHKIRRDLDLVFEGYVKTGSGDSGCDLIDTMIKELEVSIYANRKLGGLAKDTVLVSIELDNDDSGDEVFTAVKVLFSTTYWTHRGAPDVSI